MNLEQTKNEIIKYGDIVDSKGFSPGTSGNMSCRFEDKILISSSGSSNGALVYEDLVLIDFKGNVVEGDKNASSEKMLHVEFYKKRPDINAIIHVHPIFLSSFAAARKSLEEPVMAENVFYFGEIPLADYALPSSKALVDNTAKYFDKYNAVLMANHGFIVGDIDIAQAYLKLELAESYAQVVLNSTILGGAVLLNEKEVAQIKALKKLICNNVAVIPRLNKVNKMFYSNPVKQIMRNFLDDKLRLLAFTLAEVLIVLGIIGVVAEMTIPTLTASYQKQLLLVQLKENYSLISQALIQIAADNDCPGSLSCTGLFTGDQATFDVLSKYVKVTKNCGYGAGGCFASNVSDRYDGVSKSDWYESGGGNHRYKFIIANGASFYMGSGVATGRANCDYTWVTSSGATHDLDTVCGSFLLDVNGPNHGPNNIGRDLFWFYIADGRSPMLYPMGGRDDAGWYGQGYCSTANPAGYTCAARIIEQDGWQIKY